MKIIISSMSVQYFQNYIRSFFFAKYLVAEGHKVTILTASPINRWYKFSITNIDGVKVIVIPDIVNWRLRRGGLGPFNLFFRFFYILFHSFDIYHGDGHRPVVLWPILFARLLSQKPFISEWMDIFGEGGIHDSRNPLDKFLIGPYDKYFELKTRELADGSVVLSRSLFNKVTALNVPKEKVLLLHGGADIEDIIPLPIKKCREKLDLPQNKFIFGIVGVNKDDLPDLELLFSVIRKLPSQQKRNILFISSGSLENFEKVLEEKEMHQYFKHFGWLQRESYNTFICSANIMLMPMHDNERNQNKWPNKLGDFFAAGRAVITNPVGDVPEYFDKKNIGFLIKDGNEGLDRTIKYCIDNEPEIMKLGQNARAFSETNISWQAKTKELILFYTKLLKNGTR